MLSKNMSLVFEQLMCKSGLSFFIGVVILMCMYAGCLENSKNVKIAVNCRHEYLGVGGGEGVLPCMGYINVGMCAAVKDVYKTWTVLHGPSHGPGPWTTMDHP